MKVKESFVAITLTAFLALAGCGGKTTSVVTTSGQTQATEDQAATGTSNGIGDVLISKLENIDWIAVTEGTIKGLKGFQAAAKLGLGLPCNAGMISDEEICEAYKIADKQATIAFTQAQQALEAYKANPTGGTELALKVAYQAMIGSWNGWQEINDKELFIDANGQAIVSTTINP